MLFYNIFIFVFLIVIILRCVKHRMLLVVPTKKRTLEVVALVIVILVFVGLMYFYANVWWHYIFGIVCIILMISFLLADGITSEGFMRSVNRYDRVVYWKQIDKAIVINYPDDVKVKLFGNFMEQTFHFKKSDYDKVINMLHENLPVEAEIQILIGR